MKNNQLTFILAGVLFLTTLGTVALSYKLTSSLRKWQTLQVKILLLGNTQRFLGQLIGQSEEYAKKDPGINPILQSINGANPNSAATLPPR
jgi:hypothetical protein